MKPTEFSQSLQLLIILCKTSWSEQDLAIITEFNLEGNEVLDLAQRHRVTPLIWSALQRIELFSSEVREKFKQLSFQNQIKAIQSKALQGKLLSVFQNSEEKGFFLKGSGLAERYYEDIGERHVLDIDWFLDQERIIPLTKELIKWGYNPSPDITLFNTVQWRYFKYIHHDIYLSPPPKSDLLPLELHWRLRGPWGSFNLKTKTSLNPVDEFLYLCVHGTEHGWFRLKWLMDLPRIIEKNHFSWEVIWSRAVELNCQKQISITLMLLDKLCLMPMPIEWASKIDMDQYRFQLDYIYDAIISEKGFNENDMNRWRYFRYLWTFRPKGLNLAYWMILLTSPNDWQTIRLPESLFYLYIPLRPFIWLYRRLRG